MRDFVDSLQDRSLLSPILFCGQRYWEVFPFMELTRLSLRLSLGNCSTAYICDMASCTFLGRLNLRFAVTPSVDIKKSNVMPRSGKYLQVSSL